MPKILNFFVDLKSWPLLQGCLKNRIQLRAVIVKIDIQSLHRDFMCFKTNPNALYDESI